MDLSAYFHFMQYWQQMETYKGTNLGLLAAAIWIYSQLTARARKSVEKRHKNIYWFAILSIMMVRTAFSIWLVNLSYIWVENLTAESQLSSLVKFDQEQRNASLYFSLIIFIVFIATDLCIYKRKWLYHTFKLLEEKGNEKRGWWMKRNSN